MTDNAFIIGRFQPLHRGHEDLIDYARDRYDDITLFIAEGRDQPSERNPLTLEERDQLLETVYEDAHDITIDHLPGDSEAIHDGTETVIERLATEYDDPEAPVCVTENPETIDALDSTYSFDRPPDNGFRDEPYRGGYVRDQAADGGDWEAGVSDTVATELDQYRFEERMADLQERPPERS